MCHCDCLFRAACRGGCSFRNDKSDICGTASASRSSAVGFGLRLEGLAVDQDLVDLDLDEALAVTLHLLVLLLALELEDEDLVAAAFAEDRGGNLGAGEVGLELALFAADGEDVGELDCAFCGRCVSIFNFSPGETRYCLPPVRITAYITKTSKRAR